MMLLKARHMQVWALSAANLKQPIAKILSTSFCNHSPHSLSLPWQHQSFRCQTGGSGLYMRRRPLGVPVMYVVTYDKPTWQPFWEDEYEVMPRDEFGVPASIPPEVSTTIRHTYHVPPHFFPFLKKLGDDTPALKPYMTKLIQGEMTFQDYEEMFYKFAKPLRIFRSEIPTPYRTPEEQARSEEVNWESAWLSFRQRVQSGYTIEIRNKKKDTPFFLTADYYTQTQVREYIAGALLGIYFWWLWIDAHRQYRLDMKLFYLEAPEHKINWVKPRGDLV